MATTTAAAAAHATADVTASNELLLMASAAAAAAASGGKNKATQQRSTEEAEKEKVKQLQEQVEHEQKHQQQHSERDRQHQQRQVERDLHESEKHHPPQQVESDEQQQEKHHQKLLAEEGNDERHASRSILLFCTNNQHKLQEAQKILDTREALLLCADMHLIELQCATPEEVARAKCVEALYRLQRHWRSPSQHKKVAAPTPQRVCEPPPPLIFTEDTCLCFEALNGMPGPYVKWFLKSTGPETLCKLLHGFDACWRAT